MPGCSFIKQTGGRCKAQAMRDSQWCYVHNPDLAETRSRNNRKGGKRGGRGRPMAELGNLKAQLADLYTNVLNDVVDPKVGAVLAQITNAQIRITEVELMVKEQLELEERIVQLEQQHDRGGNRSSWG